MCHQTPIWGPQVRYEEPVVHAPTNWGLDFVRFPSPAFNRKNGAFLKGARTSKPIVPFL